MVLIFVLGLLKIMLVNVILSGDNAVVIALASRNLEKKQRTLAILGGTGGAVILRVLLTLVAVLLLQIPYLQFCGGLLLVWIAVQLLLEKEEEGGVKAHSTLGAAIWTIIVADVVMSLDNTLAIAAVAQGDLWLLGLGLALSIPIIVFGSQLILKIMEKFPLIVYAGAGLIAWTAGAMMVEDTKVSVFIPEGINTLVAPVLTALVVGGCWASNVLTARAAKKQNPEAPASPSDDAVGTPRQP